MDSSLAFASRTTLLKGAHPAALGAPGLGDSLTIFFNDKAFSTTGAALEGLGIRLHLGSLTCVTTLIPSYLNRFGCPFNSLHEVNFEIVVDVAALDLSTIRLPYVVLLVLHREEVFELLEDLVEAPHIF